MNWFGFNPAAFLAGGGVTPPVDVGPRMQALAKRWMAEFLLDESKWLGGSLPNLTDAQLNAVQEFVQTFAEDLKLEAGQTGQDEWHAARQPSIPISDERI